MSLGTKRHVRACVCEEGGDRVYTLYTACTVLTVWLNVTVFVFQPKTQRLARTAVIPSLINFFFRSQSALRCRPCLTSLRPTSRLERPSTSPVHSLGIGWWGRPPSPATRALSGNQLYPPASVSHAVCLSSVRLSVDLSALLFALSTVHSLLKYVQVKICCCNSNFFLFDYTDTDTKYIKCNIYIRRTKHNYDHWWPHLTPVPY